MNSLTLALSPTTLRVAAQASDRSAGLPLHYHSEKSIIDDYCRKNAKALAGPGIQETTRRHVAYVPKVLDSFLSSVLCIEPRNSHSLANRIYPLYPSRLHLRLVRGNEWG